MLVLVLLTASAQAQQATTRTDPVEGKLTSRVLSSEIQSSEGFQISSAARINPSIGPFASCSPHLFDMLPAYAVGMIKLSLHDSSLKPAWN